MKKLILSILLLCAFGAPYAEAQNSTTKQEPLTEKASKFWKKTKKNLEQAGQEIKDALGINSNEDELGNEKDLINIDNVYYMPIYNVNLYAGQDAMIYRDSCRSIFMNKFPRATIQSVVLPQKEWISETLKKDDKVVGYLQTIYCYVVARDGEEGYLNAKFLFQRYREAGGEYEHVLNKWPKWIKTEVLPNDIYERLITK